jgi:NAD(P)-dependent dehydrogenase (short-subunit alcohol dehydrogenase family)
MTRVLAVEWAKYKIRTLNIAPGYIETDLNKDFLESEKVNKLLSERIPTGGPGKAEDVAKLVAALLVEDIPFMTGSTIYLDGGQTFAH